MVEKNYLPNYIKFDLCFGYLLSFALSDTQALGYLQYWLTRSHLSKYLASSLLLGGLLGTGTFCTTLYY